MFQIIYRRIYLLYVLVDSFGSTPPHPVTVFVTFGLFLSVTASLPSAEVVGPHGAATEKKTKYDATLLSFKSDKYTVAEHQKGGGAVWCR